MQPWHAEEVAVVEAVPVLREYPTSVPVTAAYWNVDSGSTDDQIATDSGHYPVFRLSRAS